MSTTIEYVRFECGDPEELAVRREGLVSVVYPVLRQLRGGVALRPRHLAEAVRGATAVDDAEV
ncbi:hypothetical protein ABZ705_34175, partial [Streptomyces sp. NPDC006984]|uniref:hypothetical protein n=1 Tax=Streptomyces sp. NPDC006984 TaxID=3155463 RepID=UPI0033FDF6F5